MLKVTLIVVSGKPEGKEIPLVGPVFRIGRDETCHLKPNSVEVSRQHSEIAIGETEVTIRDLGSRNGTLISGKPIVGVHKLTSGELLKIGPLTFAVSIQGIPTPAVPARPATPGKSPSSDVVPPDQIGTWLVADHTRPTPDRPSGVYDGDTLTIDAYTGAGGTVPTSSTNKAKPPSSAAQPAAAKPPSSTAQPASKAPSSASQPVAKPPSSAAQPAAAKPGSAPTQPVAPIFEEMEFERLEEGAGDAAAEADGLGDDTDDPTDSDSGGSSYADAEFLDESNPFYVAKKAASAKETEQASKQSYKDTSDAANDILRKMLERRRAGRS